MIPLEEHPRGLILKLFVQPRSSKNCLAGLHGDALKIRLTAPPVDGAANASCIDYLAKLLNVPKSSMEIISGRSGRAKRMLIDCTWKEDVEKERRRIQNILASLISG